MLAFTWSQPGEIDAALARMRDLTDRPFGVNLILEWPQEERLRRCLDAGVRIISFFWGDPGPMVPIAHEAGALVHPRFASFPREQFENRLHRFRIIAP